MSTAPTRSSRSRLVDNEKSWTLDSSLARSRGRRQHLHRRAGARSGSWTGAPLHNFLKLMAPIRIGIRLDQCADKDSYDFSLGHRRALHPQTRIVRNANEDFRATVSSRSRIARAENASDRMRARLDRSHQRLQERLLGGPGYNWFSGADPPRCRQVVRPTLRERGRTASSTSFVSADQRVDQSRLADPPHTVLSPPPSCATARPAPAAPTHSMRDSAPAHP